MIAPISYLRMYFRLRKEELLMNILGALGKDFKPPSPSGCTAAERASFRAAVAGCHQGVHES